jgi:hypothetical protein
MSQQILHGGLIEEGCTAKIYAWGDGQALKVYRTG